MTKKEKTKQEYIEVPVNWLSDLVRYAKIAEKDKEFILHLIGYASSADVLLKRKNRIIK